MLWDNPHKIYTDTQGILALILDAHLLYVLQSQSYTWNSLHIDPLDFFNFAYASHQQQLYFFFSQTFWDSLYIHKSDHHHIRSYGDLQIGIDAFTSAFHDYPEIIAPNLELKVLVKFLKEVKILGQLFSHCTIDNLYHYFDHLFATRPSLLDIYFTILNI